MARKPREFQPARGKGRRRTKEEAPAAAPKAEKKRGKEPRPEPVDELEMLDSEEDVARGQLESAIVVTTCVGLIVSALLMIPCCTLMFDLVRTMWAWDEPNGINSVLLDSLGSIF